MKPVSMTEISDAIRLAAIERRGPQGRLEYITDGQRHLICLPYKVEYLHVMAAELGIKRCWYHAGTYPHYDIPKRRIAEIEAKCRRVTTKELISLCREAAAKMLIDLAKDRP